MARCFSLLALLLWAHGTGADDAFSLSEVSPGVFVHFGVHEIISPSNSGDISNFGFIVGAEAVAVIDTGGSYRLGRLLRQAITKITDLPIHYVILSHVHPDHIFGAAAFYNEDVEVIGHARLEQAMAQRGQFYMDRFEPILGVALHGSRIVAPTMKVTSSLEIDLGQRRITITAHRTAHTAHDLTVLDHETKSLWASDLLFRDRIPSIDGSVLGWLKVVAELRTIAADRVIPGHGPVGLWPQAADDQGRYLDTLVTEVREAIAKRVPIQEAMVRVGRSERENWLLFEDYHPSNISRAYAELEWE